MVSSSTLILSLKALLISTGVVSLAVFFKFSVPHLMEFAIYEIPLIWSTLLSWLKPPYLYFVINAIIITIVASSRFHPKLDGESSNTEPLIQAKPPPPSDLPLEFAPVQVLERIEAPTLDVITPVVVNSVQVARPEDENEFVIARSTWTPPQRTNSPEEYCFPVSEKPLVSSRFSHRKPTKASPEAGGRALLRVAKPKTQETLESTWKTITDGRHVPLSRHLKKSDTFENHGRPSAVDWPSDRNVTKSETFRDRTNYETAVVRSSSPGSGGKLRKEASPSQDELNRRVEAFIKKFNEEMRLQRQESLKQKQYMEMVNRETH